MRCVCGEFPMSRLGKAFASRRTPRLIHPNKAENFLFYPLFNLVGGKTMKKLLLIGLVAGILAFVPAQRSDAGVAVGIGIGPGYYGYYPYGYYYPYRYYRPYPYYGYYRPYYWYGGHR